MAAVVMVVVVVAGGGGRAQPVFTGAEIFPPEEFAARRAKIFAAIGDGVAALQGTTERPGEQPLRQNNQFFYLTGVVEPRALLWLDGRTRQATVYLQPNDERRRRQIERM
jgi:Xaa-Pro aminopeptidase